MAKTDIAKAIFGGRLAQLNGAQTKVLLVYVAYEQNNGVALITRETLMEETGLCLDSVSMARSALVRMGWLRLVSNRDASANQRWVAPSYTVHIP